MKFDPSSPSSLARERRKKIMKNKYPPMPALSSVEPSNNKRNKKRKLDITESIVPPKNESANTNKYNLRYDPDEPMTEEQKAEWRKEQRKARNRASAAASRQKTRARIEELEAEVDQLKSMYAAAVQRITELESGVPATAATPLRAPSSNNTIVSPPSTPPLSPVARSSSPMEMPSLLGESCTDDTDTMTTTTSNDAAAQATTTDHHHDAKQHVIETHSRPA